MNLLKIFLIFIVVTQSESMILDCTYSDYKEGEWLTRGPGYQCVSTVNLLDDSDPSVVSNVTGNHAEGKTNNDVDAFWIYGQGIKSVPKGIEAFFPNLKAITFGNNKITAVTRDDIRVFTTLEYLSFYDNELTMLDDDLFTSSPTLLYVELGTNQIRNIEKNTFKPLKSLTTLRMDKNSCIDKNAFTREEVQSLTSSLPESCPPRSCEMVIKDFCSLKDKKMDSKIENIETKLDALKVQIENLAEKMKNIF